MRDLLDTSAATALAGRHKPLNLLAGNMARSPGDRLCVPALCLMQAETRDETVSRTVLALSGVAVDDLDTIAAVSVGAMIRDGFGGPDTCHALYCALPLAEYTGMSILLTVDEGAYPPGVVTVDIDSPGMLGFH
ncbi:hypothetical protein ACFW9V_08995 [Streptomyces hygroscopicus]|uniref:hypothetical protein n=1 Tax=Streptomyces hygroscopicus TaxID=1912 RepID=UPI0036879926